MRTAQPAQGLDPRSSHGAQAQARPPRPSGRLALGRNDAVVVDRHLPRTQGVGDGHAGRAGRRGGRRWSKASRTTATTPARRRQRDVQWAQSTLTDSMPQREPSRLRRVASPVGQGGRSGAWSRGPRQRVVRSATTPHGSSRWATWRALTCSRRRVREVADAVVDLAGDAGALGQGGGAAGGLEPGALGVRVLKGEDYSRRSSRHVQAPSPPPLWFGRAAPRGPRAHKHQGQGQRTGCPEPERQRRPRRNERPAVIRARRVVSTGQGQDRRAGAAGAPVTESVERAPTRR